MRKIRVLVVDDSVVIRRLLTELLSSILTLKWSVLHPMDVLP
ncbi:MAG: hypothetical protein ACKVH8_16445 [Pirellulales bacterium]